MRIAFNQNKYTIEKDSRVSKSNFWLRPDYSIKIAILQKRIIYNNSKLTNQVTVYNMTDLEACYDWQFSLIRSIVEESIGVER